MTDAEFCKQARKLFAAGLVPWPEWDELVHRVDKIWDRNRYRLYRYEVHADTWQWRVKPWPNGYFHIITDHEAACIIERALREWLETQEVVPGLRGCWTKWELWIGCHWEAFYSYREALLAAVEALDKKVSTSQEVGKPQ